MASKTLVYISGSTHFCHMAVRQTPDSAPLKSPPSAPKVPTPPKKIGSPLQSFPQVKPREINEK